MQNAAPLFGGLIVPTLTPLTKSEQLDYDALKRHVAFLVESGVDALFVLGSNGEGAMLRRQTRLDVVVATLEAVAGRLPVICGVLEISTARIIEELASFAGLGLAGYVVTTPLYFNGFQETDLVKHFEAIAENADAPILIYNIPQSTRFTMTESLVRAVAAVPNVAGLKDSSGNWPPFQRLLLDRPGENFALLQGYHELSAVSLVAGADGLVPGYANIYPALFVEMRTAAQERRWDRALELQGRLDRLLILRGSANVHASKVLSSALGLMADSVTTPLPRLDEAAAAELIRASVAAGLPLEPGGFESEETAI
jgi:4-hydroxy-tetrahydrodipicolinate synthase